MSASSKMTIKDLAKELEISPATVSRALNDSPLISDKVKERVKKLAKERNFKPNSIASGFRKGRTLTVGVIVPNINRHYFSNVIHSIENVLVKANYNILICETNNSLELEKRHLDMLINNRVSGIIISVAKVAKSGAHLKTAINAGIKVVQFDNVMEDVTTSIIKNDDRSSAKIVVANIIKQGYKRIALFTGTLNSMVYQQRKQGYLDALEEAGMAFNEELQFIDTNSREEGEEAAKKMLEEKVDFDAIFSCGDFAALGAFLVLRDAGVKIPEEVGIAGCANEPFTEFTTPSITSVDQDSNEIGRIAAEQLLKEVENPKTTPLLALLPNTPQFRESTQRS